MEASSAPQPMAACANHTFHNQRILTRARPWPIRRIPFLFSDVRDPASLELAWFRLAQPYQLDRWCRFLGAPKGRKFGPLTYVEIDAFWLNGSSAMRRQTQWHLHCSDEFYDRLCELAADYDFNSHDTQRDCHDCPH